MPSLVLFILNAVRGGRPRCILWLRPEECLLVCKIPMSKYLRFFCFCFPFKILQGERRDCFWGVWKFGWICSIQVGCQHELNYIWKLTSPLPSPPPFLPELLFFCPPPPRSWGRGRGRTVGTGKYGKTALCFQTKVFFPSKTFLKQWPPVHCRHFYTQNFFFFKQVPPEGLLNILAGLKSDPFWERSLLSFFPPGMLI